MNDINILEEKYIDLLLNKCLNFKKSKSLFISYNKTNQDFIDKLVIKANEMGINDIGFDCEDIFITHDKLKNISLEDIEKDPYFNKEIWNIYAERNASFLIFTSEFPHVMDDIDSKKITMAGYINRKTRKLFREKEISYEIPWCIAALPNEIWAKDIFPNSNNAYQELFLVIFKMCMVDKESPIKSWDKYLDNLAEKVNYLNNLNIKSMHYKNSLGTDLTIYMNKDSLWSSACLDRDLDMFVNMPSYEVFSSPNYLKTEGIVYNSKPLVFLGEVIDNFYLKFKNGKVIDFNAETGYNVLAEIIKNDNNSCYLGEVALVNYDSPISNTNLIFGTTLFDENASCHLALGDGFRECLKNGNNLTKEELLLSGVNQSDTHVDFMIGTNDLEIEVETFDGNKLVVFKNGNFNI